MGFPFKEINDILLDVRMEFDNINRGGCGAMAAMLAFQMQKIADEVKIVTCGGHANVDEVRHNIKNNSLWEWETQGVEFYHVWVEFKWNNRWYAMDSEGIKTRRMQYRRWRKPSPGSFTLNEMRNLARGGGWNWAFNRDQLHWMRPMISRRFTKLVDTISFSYV